METNQDLPEVLETTGTEAATGETAEETLTPEQIAELKAKAAKADELEQKNKQLFERAKKAETDKKVDAPSQDGLSNKDVLFLAKADIHEDDLDDVIDYARLKKIPVAEAHKFMKPILAERAEERRTAAATRTGSGARGASKATGDDLLRKADQSGEVPESDDGIKALVEARLARKKQK